MPPLPQSPSFFLNEIRHAIYHCLFSHCGGLDANQSSILDASGHSADFLHFLLRFCLTSLWPPSCLFFPPTMSDTLLPQDLYSSCYIFWNFLPRVWLHHHSCCIWRGGRRSTCLDRERGRLGVGRTFLLKGQGNQVTGQTSRLQHSCLSLIIQRHGIRHGRLRGLVWQILKTSSCLFVGVKVFLGGPEKLGAGHTLG